MDARAGILLCCLLAGAVRADDFAACLDGLGRRAREAGVDAELVAAVLPRLRHQPRVVELDRSQPEFVQSFAAYLERRLTPERVRRGRDLFARYRDFLDGLTHRYGVPGQYLIALWGLETHFGGYLGSMPTLDALATLACDGRRGEYFAGEFVTALELLARQGLSPERLRGSWAGALGHTQFMPSTYLRYAVDGDGDGRIDLLGSERDALASGARFLAALGWRAGLRWGREVRLPEGFDYRLADGQWRELDEWAARGVRAADGSALPRLPVAARLLVPAGHRGPAFLVYHNFEVILGWNRSEFYALSVGLLADRIAGGEGLHRPPPPAPPLPRSAVLELQRGLAALGYPVGEADGVIGPATRRALAAFQTDRGLVADGHPDAAAVEKVREALSAAQAPGR